MRAFEPDCTRDVDEPLPEKSQCKSCGKPLRATDYRIRYELCTPCLVPGAVRERRLMSTQRKVVKAKKEGK